MREIAGSTLPLFSEWTRWWQNDGRNQSITIYSAVHYVHLADIMKVVWYLLDFCKYCTVYDDRICWCLVAVLFCRRSNMGHISRFTVVQGSGRNTRQVVMSVDLMCWISIILRCLLMMSIISIYCEPESLLLGQCGNFKGCHHKMHVIIGPKSKLLLGPQEPSSFVLTFQTLDIISECSTYNHALSL